MSRQATLWTAAGVYVLVIYAFAAVARPLFDLLDRVGLLRATVAAVLGLAAAAGVAWVVRERPRAGEIVLLGIGGGVYLLFLSRLELAQERIHVAQYGLLGALIWGALRARWGQGRRLRAALLATVLTGLAGWGDEGLQHLIPGRYYDLRDVVVNAASGALLVALAAARERLRERTAATVQ